MQETMQDKIKVYQKINKKIKYEIKKILNYYLIDTSYYKLEIDDGNPKYVLRVQCWSGPKRGLGFIAKEIAQILKENGVTEVGKIIIEYELKKRKVNQKAVTNIGEALQRQGKK